MITGTDGMKAEKRKKLILAGAKKMFARKGYYETKISDIIKDVKIARGTIYQYFSNKNDIFITLLEDFYKEWEKTTSISFEELKEKNITPKNYFKYRIRKSLEFFANDRDLCNIILRMGHGLGGELEDVIERIKVRIINIFIEELKFGIYNDLVKKDLNIELTASLITGALFFTAEFYFSRQNNYNVDIEKTTEEIVSIFSPGIFRMTNGL